MSVINEDPGLFEDSASSIDIVTAMHRYPGKLLTVRCRLPGSLYCAGCIGHKYNLEYGCPICGAKTSLIDGTLVLYKCEQCSSVILECGCRDVRAVSYVPETVNTLRSTEDII